MYKKLQFIICLNLIVFSNITYADAITEAYDAGYAKGIESCSFPGGGSGSQGIELGIKIPESSGGSTSGYEIPWAFQFDNLRQKTELLEKSVSSKVTTTSISDNKKVSEMFESKNIKTGTVVIKGISTDHLEELNNFMKSSKVQQYWVAPTVK